MTIGVILLIIIHIAILISQLIVNPTHLSDPTWTMHAKDHLVRGIADMVGLNLVALLVAYYPLRKGERWAWWALVIAGLALIGGALTSGYISHEPFEPMVRLVFIGMGIVYILGLALTWNNLKK